MHLAVKHVMTLHWDADIHLLILNKTYVKCLYSWKKNILIVGLSFFHKTLANKKHKYSLCYYSKCVDRKAS